VPIRDIGGPKNPLRDGSQREHEQDYDHEHENSAMETFTSKVIKDLSFQDEGAEYTAYLVKWREHEVVVTAPVPSEERYMVGDSIRCHMIRREVSRGDTKRNQITFMIAGTIPHDAERLKAVAAEVAARRAVREKAAREVKRR